MRAGDMHLVSQIKIATHHVSSQNSIKYCKFFLTETDCHEEVLVHCSNSLTCNDEPICIDTIIQHGFNMSIFLPWPCWMLFRGKRSWLPIVHCREAKIHSLLHRPAAEWEKTPHQGNSQPLAVCVQEFPPHHRAWALITMVTPFHQSKTSQMQRQNQTPSLTNVPRAYCWLLKWCQMSLLK